MALGQIRTDSSLGLPGQTLGGTNVVIPQTLGRLAGGNLFHSFETFNIQSGQSVNFTMTNAGIGNVISRVTGGSPSQINGQLKMTPAGGAPNFFFINPAGVAFGAGASIDVPGAFHVSTANYVKFPDGNFHADLNRTSTFSSAAPEAFGFLGTSRASISVNNGALLITRPGKAISIIGGDVGINFADVGTREGGDVRVVALGSRIQEVSFTGALSTASGNLNIQNGGTVSTYTTSSANAGAIKIAAGNVLIDRQGGPYWTGIYSDAYTGSTGNAGNIGVTASGDVSILRGGTISSDAYAAGAAGHISLSGSSVTIDRQGSTATTGLYSDANSGLASSGGIDVAASGAVSVVNGGTISSSSWASGNSGAIEVSGGSVLIDGQSGGYWTGIYTFAASNTGNAGAVDVTASGPLAIVRGGAISSDAYVSSRAGLVKASGRDVGIDGVWSTAFTGISSNAYSGTASADGVEITSGNSLWVGNGGSVSSRTWASGDAGPVTASVQGAMTLINGGTLDSVTFASGKAGAIAVSAGTLGIDGYGQAGPTGILSQARAGTGDAGNVEVSVGNALSVVDGGMIDTSTYTAGNAGSVSVKAGSMNVDNRSRILFTGVSSTTSGMGNAGNTQVEVRGLLSILDGAQITSSTFASGNAGTVNVSARDISIDGRNSELATGIVSHATLGSLGNAGTVEVSAIDALNLRNGGSINSSTEGAGNGGSVKVSAGRLTIEGNYSEISSDALPGSTGNAGSVDVDVTGLLSILNGGRVTSSSFAGSAGNITINAHGTTIDDSLNGAMTGVFTQLTPGTFGSGGDIVMNVQGTLALLNGSQISASTSATGTAGTIRIGADDLTIDGRGTTRPTGIFSQANASTGNAGDVQVAVANEISISGGVIDSSTFAAGNAGTVRIDAGNMRIDGSDAPFTSVSSVASLGSTGDAGNLVVNVEHALTVSGGGFVIATTSGAGKAGTVNVRANTIVVDGSPSRISASASANSSGQTGDVIVAASESLTLSNGGEINIENYATVTHPEALTPAKLTVSAPDITLKDAAINAESTGNVAAGNIEIRFGNSLFIDPSSISTSANLGNGGSITILGGKLITLDNSQITTSVAGLAGNGGNISISADTLIMNTGFIQANTAAANASGGLVVIDVGLLVASGGILFVGGTTPYAFQPGVAGFNVIQAAAPTGVSGTVQLASPVLDLSGSLAGLNAAVIDTGGLGRNPCQTTGGSSLSQVGRGGMPPSARGLLRAELPISTITAGASLPIGGSLLRLAQSGWQCS